MSKTMTPIATIILAGAFHIIRGIAMVIPMTGSKRIARTIFRFFFKESLKLGTLLILGYSLTKQLIK